MILFYLLKGLISMPQSMQDFVYQLVSTSGLGYVGVLLIKLYRIHPALPIVSIMVVAVIIHLVIKSGQEKDRFGRLKSIVPLASDTPSSNHPSKDTSNSQQVVPINTNDNNNSNGNSNSSHVTRRQSVIAALTISEQLLKHHEANSNHYTKHTISDTVESKGHIDDYSNHKNITNQSSNPFKADNVDDDDDNNIISDGDDDNVSSEDESSSSSHSSDNHSSSSENDKKTGCRINNNKHLSSDDDSSSDNDSHSPSSEEHKHNNMDDSGNYESSSSSDEDTLME
jgi:hypothetical protein